MSDETNKIPEAFDPEEDPNALTEGDIIEITLGARTVKVRVTAVKEVVRKEDAATMYEAVV